MIRISTVFTQAALIGLLTGGSAWAAEGEEAQLQAAEQETEAALAERPQSARVNALAEQYQVDPSVVQDLRNKGRGWGEINTELAMAKELNRTDPATYPTLSDGLQKVDSMRDQKQGWGRIAQDLGFKLGPVVREAKQTHREIRSEIPKPQKLDRPDRAEKFDRPENPNKKS